VGEEQGLASPAERVEGLSEPEGKAASEAPSIAGQPASSPAADSLRLLEYEKVVARIVRLAASEPGRRRAASLVPLADARVVETRLARVRDALALLESGARLPLASVRDLEPLFRRLHEESRILEPADLLAVAETLSAARGTKSRVESSKVPLPALGSLVAPLPDMKLLEGKIRAAVDERARVRDDASEKLARLRRELKSLRDRVRQLLSEMARSPSRKHVLQSSAILLRSGRYVLSVRAEARAAIRGIIHDKSQTGSTVFLEPDDVVEPQNRIQDLAVEEGREETRILLGLSREVLSVEAGLVETISICADADLAVASAEYARKYGASVPSVAEGGPLVLKDARHPLLLAYRMDSSGVSLPDECGVVPVSLRLGDDFDLLVITGPNTGGKTVTLKTVGLLALAAASGLPVTAAPESRIPLYRRVLADIGDEQSLEQNLSTFSGHVRNLEPIVRLADENSLVLIDELGSGTDPAEGAALGTAILETLARRRTPAVVTTHIGHLKVFSYRQPRSENACVEFDPETLRPTFRLQIGEPGRSNAVEIARRLGFPAEIVDRAAELASASAGPADRLMADLEASRVASEKKRDETERLRREALERKRELDAAMADAEELRHVLERESDHALDEAIARAGERIVALVAALRQDGAVTPEALARIESAVRGEMAATPLREKRREFARHLRRDDIVYLPRYRNRGTVRRVDRTRESVEVRVGSLDVTVGFDEVSWMEIDRSRKP